MTVFIISWIKIVAPVRERGLKYPRQLLDALTSTGRSREGAWIEILNFAYKEQHYQRRSREGAWIEIAKV